MPLTGERKREYQREWMQKRRQEYLDSQGNMCAICGDKFVPFDIDHIDKNTKEIPISSLWSRRKEVREAELEKCQILCEPCHAEKSAAEMYVPITHGDYNKGYSRGCRCTLCKSSVAIYWRNYRANK